MEREINIQSWIWILSYYGSHDTHWFYEIFVVDQINDDKLLMFSHFQNIENELKN